jgi:hypothetical protein
MVERKCQNEDVPESLSPTQDIQIHLPAGYLAHPKVVRHIYQMTPAVSTMQYGK